MRPARYSAWRRQGKADVQVVTTRPPQALVAARTSSCISFRNRNCIAKLLVVYAAPAYEAACDGSFHVRHQNQLLRSGAVLSAPPHDGRLPAPRSAGIP